MRSSPITGLTAQDVGERIRRIRGRNVLLDADLATLYGVSTGRLNEQVKRNSRRFPADFTFRLTSQEAENLKSQIAISSSTAGSWGGRRRSFPLAFTEHGALMAANILSSSRQLVDALRQLMSVPAPTRRPIGFVTAKT